MILFNFFSFLFLLFSVVISEYFNIKFENDGLDHLIAFINDKSINSLDTDSYNFDFYKDESIDKNYKTVVSKLLSFSNKFYNLDEEIKSSKVQDNKETYVNMIQLLITGLLNKWYLTEAEEYTDSDIYIRNALIIVLESLLDIEDEVNIGNIDNKTLLDLINSLSSSLYYYDAIVSFNNYLLNTDILNAPAYSAIGRGYDNKEDYKMYIDSVNNINEINDYNCPCSFDHRLSLLILGKCKYNEFMLENTNKYNLVYLYQNASSSFILSNRYIYSFQEAFQYFNYASNIIFNRHRFSEKYNDKSIIIDNNDIENNENDDNIEDNENDENNNNIENDENDDDIEDENEIGKIVNELFTPYSIESILYKLKKYNLNILPINVYYKDEYNSIIKDAVSLFNAYSDIMLTIYNICNYQDFQSSIINIIFDLYKDIKNLSNDIYNADEVDEYNNIVRMFNTLFANNNEITLKLIEKINYYYLIDIYINKYYNYYPENQLSE